MVHDSHQKWVAKHGMVHLLINNKIFGPQLDQDHPGAGRMK